MSSEVKAGFKRTNAGIVPSDWSSATIEDIGFTSSGTTPSRSQFERYFRGGQINWVKTLDLNNSWIYATEEQVTSTAIEETSLRVYSPGAVLVAMYGGFNQIGRTGLLKVPACVNQAITAIQCREILRPEYLLATLNFRSEYWKSVASSSRKDPNITSKDIRDFPIAYPAQHEQGSIAAALSDMDALISGLDQLITKKRDIKQATMQQLLTGQTRLPGFSGEWEVSSFNDVFYRVNGKPYSIQSSSYQETGDFPVIDQGKDLVVAYSDRKDKLFPCPDGGVVVFGDHTCIVKLVDFDFIVGADGTQVLSVKDGHSARFHKYQLEYSGIPTTGYNRHFKFIKERSFTSPTLLEQEAIALTLSEIDNEISVLEARRDKANKIKHGMMQELLTGRIRLV